MYFKTPLVFLLVLGVAAYFVLGAPFWESVAVPLGITLIVVVMILYVNRQQIRENL